MDNTCTIYIDEAGDLGVDRGTQWFILTAVVVNSDDEIRLREIIKSIKTKLNIQNIHFRQLRGFEQRSYVVNELSKGNFEYISIIVDTSKITLKCEKPTDKPSFVTYNYACRFLLERVSWLLRDTNRIGKVVLSSRGTARDQELIDYIKTKLLNYEFNEIANRFTKIESKTASSWDMLQLADVCATSMFYYHETNAYGFITPCYNYRLNKFLYKRNDKLANYGIKYYSNEMKPDSKYFLQRMICKI